MISRWRAALLVLACTVPGPLLVVACADEPAVWGDADRTFVAQMLPHHHLGLVLNDIAAQHSSDVRLRRLVFEMSGYHRSELGTLEHWARQQGVTGAAEFPGHIPDAELIGLSARSGQDFDVHWLTLMIRHHDGALRIAGAESSFGTVPAARDLAQSVSRVQSAELEEMRGLLEALCRSQVSSAC